MSNLLTQATVTTITYPFGYQRLLSQLNYEPLDYFVARSWFGFGPETRYLPNTFSYCKYNINMLNQLMAIMGSSEKKEEDDDEDEDELIRWLKDYITSATTKAIAQCTGIIVSQPFHVIMIRSVAQFVGRETAYSTLWGSITEIYNNEGILGFFSGLAPRLEFQPYTSVVAGKILNRGSTMFSRVYMNQPISGQQMVTGFSRLPKSQWS
ncbi:hypothetical protein KUTeg_007246 [Tegillarca granosa]|uniref:Uncharacterized protein n=1 Tax=Tegillarca granosa TaxID=220873 RepID=A0ABQ9FCQ7_TEGGR|nr:hypothetical protein KUTeg_007246 [Tegillarca granosa]